MLLASCGWVEATREPAQCPTLHKTAPTAEDDPAPHIHRAETPTVSHPRAHLLEEAFASMDSPWPGAGPLGPHPPSRGRHFMPHFTKEEIEANEGREVG